MLAAKIDINDNEDMAARAPKRQTTKPMIPDCGDHADDSPRSDPPAGYKRRTGDRVLVVEDELSARRGYSLLLAAEGYEVVCVENAEEGLERLGREDFDLVLSDVNLPGMDGYGFTKQLRDRDATRDLPVILVSAIGGTPRKVTGLDAGADDFLEKPVHPEELLARIRAHLRRSVRSRELERRSTHDALTGLLNRGALEEELTRELKRMSRTNLPVSLVMVDLDRFKAINDHHGHLVGDEALRRVAIKLEASVRTTDRVARWGGDEFIILLPDTDEEQMRDMVERLRLAWRRHPPMVPHAPRPIMASFGGATAHPGGTIESLVRTADAEMYRDKHGTRRR
jgi:diguanylate cyclase (GGDEF)-like protein